MKYTSKRVEIPPGISPGPLRPVYFSNMSVAQWGRVEPSALIERIRVVSE